MRYVSTRGQSEPVSAQQAIIQGLAPDGGLYVPEAIPTLPQTLWRDKMPYSTRAEAVLRLFLPGFDGLLPRFERAYSRFNHPEVAPVTGSDGHNLLELWHGPTCAFKDFALQALPHLMDLSRTLTGEKQQICVLTATSGDTGKAALEAFRDIEETSVVVFYPQDGVSAVQKLQMTTQQGANTFVSGVIGDFDVAQSGVKRLFTDAELKQTLEQRGIRLSSANSINLGRLLPQIVYYCAAYAQLVERGALRAGDKLNVCVPTGNFGNILACWMAKTMGVPIGRLVCASNANNVLTDLIGEGVYNRNRTLMKTTSPSMDILLSSNFERLLYHLSDAETVCDSMDALSRTGAYTLKPETFNRLRADFWGGCCDDAQAAKVIKERFEQDSVLLDPHTAVAWQVYDQYRLASGDAAPFVIVSTASAFKFCGAVLEALTGQKQEDTAGLIDKLSAFTGIAAPEPLSTLGGRPVRFDVSTSPEAMKLSVLGFLGI